MEYLVSLLTPVIIAACPGVSAPPALPLAPPVAVVPAPEAPVSSAERLSTQWEHRTMLIPTQSSPQIYTKTSQSRPTIRPAILTRVRER